MIRESTKIPTNARMPSDDPDTRPHMKSDVSSLKSENHEFSLLVRSLKMKSKQIQLPSKGKMPKKNEGVQSKEVEEKNSISNLVQSLKKKTKKLKQ